MLRYLFGLVVKKTCLLIPVLGGRSKGISSTTVVVVVLRSSSSTVLDYDLRTNIAFGDGF